MKKQYEEKDAEAGPKAKFFITSGQIELKIQDEGDQLPSGLSVTLLGKPMVITRWGRKELLAISVLYINYTEVVTTCFRVVRDKKAR